MKVIRFLVLLLMVIGSLNWGLVGFFQYDFISSMFGGMSMMGARVIFALVGLAGLYGIGLICRCCGCGCKCGPSCHCCNKKD
ncbi:MAG TPA: DUF378 domain-containing protein [Chlamydiales bacterium]|nr:DUF378 domain-containing protein [Chlamydiales bacterium]